MKLLRIIFGGFSGGASIYGLILVAAIALFGAGYWKGYSAASTNADVMRLKKANDDLKADRARLQRQIKSAVEAASRHNRRQAEDAREIERLKGVIHEFDESLGDESHRFILDDDDICRLRNCK